MEIEDLLQKAAALFPAYLRDLLAVLTGPKRFVARRQSERSSLEHATVFLAISVAINFVLKIPLTQENPAWEILRTAAFSFVLWLSAGVVIWIACRVVGGTGALDLHAGHCLLLLRCLRVCDGAYRVAADRHRADD